MVETDPESGLTYTEEVLTQDRRIKGESLTQASTMPPAKGGVRDMRKARRERLLGLLRERSASPKDDTSKSLVSELQTSAQQMAEDFATDLSRGDEDAGSPPKARLAQTAANHYWPSAAPGWSKQGILATRLSGAKRT